MVRDEGWAGGEWGGVVGSALTRAPRLLRGEGRLEGLVDIPLPGSRKERRGRLLGGCHAARRSKRGKGTMERLWKSARMIRFRAPQGKKLTGDAFALTLALLGFSSPLETTAESRLSESASDADADSSSEPEFLR